MRLFTIKKSLLLYILFSFSFVYGQIDYNNLENWTSHPEKEDLADLVPQAEGLKNNQENAGVDVFYIHPTTFIFSMKAKNAKIDKKKVNKRTDYVTMNQASVFNGSCKVFAPRYRQASIITFLKKPKQKRTDIFDLAYADVKKAFENYLTNHNYGRPIIIAGHSQGSYLGLRLLKEFFDGKELQDQLIAAYLIGNAAATPVEVYEDYFKELKPAQGRDDTGVVVTWNTYSKTGDKLYYFNNDLLYYNDGFQSNKGKKMVSINPLNWKTDTTFAENNLSLGGVKLEKNAKKYGLVDPQLTSAQLDNGILRIERPNAKGYKVPFDKDYHIFDYSIFYLNIRKNVADRIAAFWETERGQDELPTGK
ncbi:DUF3089 domain-containing protein [Flammeovirgaceae bacterium SG7u.111]|nr:DUF3089 domain-containing protein [Flammeovirgaceae bacterium SG7u.132]WPO36852.1 DUF3089 domain-containing protein [Flammeovirgaceae bacterium SG7u.111]